MGSLAPKQDAPRRRESQTASCLSTASTTSQGIIVGKPRAPQRRRWGSRLTCCFPLQFTRSRVAHPVFALKKTLASTGASASVNRDVSPTTVAGSARHYGVRRSNTTRLQDTSLQQQCAFSDIRALSLQRATRTCIGNASPVPSH